jgi:hypothetical protein
MADVYLPLHSQRRLIRISRKSRKDLLCRHDGSAKSGDARLCASIDGCCGTFFKDIELCGWAGKCVSLLVAEGK